MPPMSFIGRVTKVGAMRKTATVTVTRWVVHAKTGKVRPLMCSGWSRVNLTAVRIDVGKEQEIPDA